MQSGGRPIWNSLGPSAFSASRRPVFWRLNQRRHAEVAEIAQRRTELRALLQFPRFTNVIRQSIVRRPRRLTKAFGMEVTKALAALRPLYGKANIEIVTRDGNRVRGVVRSMKTTQALTTPSVKVERGDGEIVKVPFSAIVEIIDYNSRR